MANTKPKADKLQIEDLKEAAYNPRTIKNDALEGLKFSISEFGDLSGITFSAERGHLICGHQRLKALKAAYGDNLRMEGEEIVTPSGERFKVRVIRGWSEEKEKAAMIAANAKGIQGEWDKKAKPGDATGRA